MTSSTPVAVLGAGGHAKVVISTLQALDVPVLAVYDDNPERWGSTLLGVPISGPLDRVLDMQSVRGIIAIGDNVVRKSLAARFTHVEWVTAVHPRAFVDPSVHLGPGTVVFAGAVIQPDTVIGAHAIINTGATVDHDCGLGDFVHVAPGANLAGGVSLGEGVLLGVGAAVIPGRRIGAWTRVGAGGVVVRDLPERVTAVGVPARPLGSS
jgi:UDP-perosamine 4-acetyltransferase